MSKVIKNILTVLSNIRLKEVLVMQLSLMFASYGIGLAGTVDAGGIAKSLVAVSSKRIYFAHQSVGQNIIEGLKDIAKDHPGAGLKIVESSDPASLSTPAFVHSRVGKNTKPDTKMNGFAELVANGMGKAADIAFFKFCYVDITAGTDVNSLFGKYKKTMDNLKRQYPDTVFVHVTVPLTVADSTAKTLLKKLAGRQTGNDNNLKRNQFNALMKAEYASKEPVFDLAAIEAKGPGSTAEGTALSLARGYTDDGEHLNEKGRKRVAEELIKFLAAVKTRPIGPVGRR